MQGPSGEIPIQHRAAIEQLANRFELEFRDDAAPRIENFLSSESADLRPYLLRELVALELELRRSAGQQPALDEYLLRFPDDRTIVNSVFMPSTEMASTMDEAKNNDEAKNTQETGEEGPLPRQLGRYVIERQLGKGGFGVVYLAHDPRLDRFVALKVPRRERFRTQEQVADFIQEARTAAKLKHPLLVTIHDVQEEDGLPFIVQEYIEGENLDYWSAKHQPTFEQIVRILMAVTEALGYAHGQRLTHCDLKLANVLMDELGRPHVADFGLAVHESSRLHRKGARFGTSPMMAPEQVRGEGHRLDGRTDIWALGVMMYQMLVSQRPFTATEEAELYDEIETLDPRPPRQIDRNVPRELERICLKCLSKRRTDRYNTTDDLREDLQLWLSQNASTQVPQSPTVSTLADRLLESDSSSKKPVKVIPKGLRSFDAEDTDFFLELLPGPRDRDGLPESIRFWKNRIEERDPDNTFAVGLIYGPSGCGKSSLVKAGLLPRLSEQVLAVYVEATADQTELRILKRFRKHIPRLPENISLPAACAELRRLGTGRDRKVLVIIDQFEQWLHAHTELALTALVSALRQSDGGRLQFVLLVRDDFFASVNRLFRELEDSLVEGRNYALVDRFDRQHACQVLTAFGRAYGKLDDALSTSQEQFVSRAVEELVEEDKVISVRLSLFADMMKTRPWTLKSLDEMGGVSGVGVTFLEETFSGKAAPPTHREHQTAIRQVLKTLLPESGMDIKGGMRSADALQQASGYGSDQRRFDELLRILDSQLRIITPTDPEGIEKSEVTSLNSEQLPERSNPSLQTSPFTLQTSFYQLTHDYLVPSLREWLTRKQRETRRGRAELKLEERGITWHAMPENRYLPSWREFLSICLLTDKKKWTEPQRKMMGKAGRVHATHSGLLASAIAILAVLGLTVRGQVLSQQERYRVEGVVAQLTTAEPAQLPEIIRQLDAAPELAQELIAPLLESEANTIDQQRSKLHAQLAMIGRDASMVAPLLEELLSNKVAYIGPIRELLQPHAALLTERLQAMLRDPQLKTKRRFRAGVALAGYLDPASIWEDQDLQFMAAQLVTENAEYQPVLRNNLRPVSTQLLSPLQALFKDAQAADAMRLGAANAIADFAANQPELLTRLLADATTEQYEVLYALVDKVKSETGIAELKRIAAALPPDNMGSVDRIRYGQRRANAAVSLLRLGERETVLPVFDYTDDPEALTQFIFRCKPRGISVDALLDLFNLVAAAPGNYPKDARYALLLALGEYDPSEVPLARREALVNQLADWYAGDPSSGVHGAAGWLLRHMGGKEIADRVDQTAFPYSPDREWYTLAITVRPTAPLNPRPEEQEEGSEESESKEPPEPVPPKTFYYTFIVHPSGEYTIGSVEDEVDPTKANKVRYAVSLTRPFALLDREITFDELIAFSPQYVRVMEELDAKPTDAGVWADWYDSVAYCRWLGTEMGLPESDQCYAEPEALDREQYVRDPEVSWAPRNWPLDLDKRGFRLPTEAEWEVAARGGSRTAYGFGSEVALLDRFGWFIENSGKQVHPGRQLRPSVRGLFDLHGNLFEWTHDWEGNFGGSAQMNPLGAKEGSYRVIRGGSWYDAATLCRTAHRDFGPPRLRSDHFGFRLALSSPFGFSSPTAQQPEMP